jgi:transglutaminase-like putative cysteine protease
VIELLPAVTEGGRAAATTTYLIGALLSSHLQLGTAIVNFVLASDPAAYLLPATLVDSDAPEIAAFVDSRLAGCDEIEAARRAFLYVRDEVAHSWDVQGHRVTRSATEALEFSEGICYPKSHLVAALLRRRGIPAAI